MAVITRKVYAQNLKEELFHIKNLIMYYPYVAMDTEFPGTVYKQHKHSVRLGNPVLNYQYMKANVDSLNIIQLGLALCDSQGNLPDFGSANSYIWEFNFKDFDIEKDPHDKESIKLLEMQGIDFAKNREKGIDSRDFAMMIQKSGLMFNFFPRLNWITFHSSYDFGFLMKILTQKPLPCDLNSFMHQLVLIFGYHVFDIKNVFRYLEIHGGLDKVAKFLEVNRCAGSSHQAGSDSLLTLQCFMRLKETGMFQNNHRTRILPPLALYGLFSTVVLVQ